MKQCLQCGEDISHLRIDARFCQSKAGTCYSRYHSDRRNEQNRRCASKRYANNRANLLEYLKTHHCVDCGEEDPIVLEFDHRNPDTKKAKVSNILGSWNWDTIMTEIEKCEVRCANCHRRRTAKQFGWYKGGDANVTV